jgi:hypothetical protein
MALDAAAWAGQRQPRDVTATGCIQQQSPNGRSLVLAKAGGGAIYALTGARARDLAPYVGQPVEIVGRLVDGRDAPRRVGTSGAVGADAIGRRDQQQPTGATTDPVTGTGAPPGVPVSAGSRRAARDLARLEIVSFARTAGSCR